ncbi:B12-binding domain-containing radical SAM protein [Flavitalea flava]
MEILLVDNLLLKQENNIREMELQPHLGLISLIAVLEKEGYGASLYDPKLAIAKGELSIDRDLYRNIARRILDMVPDIIGFTSLGCNFICTLKIAHYVRQERPNIPILLGGPHATVLHAEIMAQFPDFDIIVRNEAEGKIIPIIEAIAEGLHAGKRDMTKLHGIEGISFREKGRIISTSGASTIHDLSQLPFPAYHAYPIEKLHIKKLRVEAGRGCPFSCTFCSTASFFGRSYRLKSAATLSRELTHLHLTYGIKEFGLSHDLFTVNETKVREFCREIASKKFQWTCSARMDCVNKDLLTVMKKAGCKAIFYGIETGSPTMQRISKKKLDLSLFHDTLRYTLELGIRPTLSFIAGYPEETKQDLDDTLDLLGSCYTYHYPTDINLQLHLLTPEPGTALILEHKDKLRFDNYISDFNFPTLEDDDPAIMQQNPAIFMNHHYYEAVLPRELYILTTSLFGALRPLGATVCKYLLSFYNGSLHQLNDAVYAWATKMNIGKITIGIFGQYLVRQFGKDSIIVSLTRWRYEVDHLKGQLFSSEYHTKVREDGNSAIQGSAGKDNFVSKPNSDQNPGFSLIRQIHPCPQILRLLEEGKKIPARLISKREDILVQVVEDKRGKCRVETYYPDKEILRLIKPIEKKILSRADKEFC